MIPGHDVRTVAYQGWKSLGNGELLKAAEDTGFAVMVTADQSIAYQQNRRGRKIALVVVSSNEREIVEAHAAEIMKAINAAKVGSFAFVEIGG